MRANRWLFLILAAYFVLASLYNFATPILETPDAIWHYAYVRQLAFAHALPVVDAGGTAPYRHEGLQPPLYYAIGSLFIFWMDPTDAANLPPQNPYAQIGLPRSDSNDNRNAFLDSPGLVNPFTGGALAIHILRFYSTILGAGTVILTYLTARELSSALVSPTGAPDNGIALLASAFVAFLPQFLFVSASVSNDNLAIVLSTLVLWRTLVVMRKGVTIRNAALLGVLVGIALLTKLNTITLVGLVALGFAYLLLKKRQWKNIAVCAAIFALVVVFIAGWWYWRNFQLYGDPTTFERLAELVGERPAQPGLIRWLSAENRGLRLSTWGIFGWFNVLMPPSTYTFFDALAVIGMIGFGVFIFRNRGLEARFILLPIWIVTVLFSLWRYSSEIVSSQGRLLFPALSAWSIIWSVGITTLSPKRILGVLQLAISTTLAIIALVVPGFVITPAYSAKILPSAIPPPELKPLQARFENGIEWLGSSPPISEVRPGESVDFALYARVPAGPATQDSIFIHLVNESNVIVAQRDSFVASGNLGAVSMPTLVVDNFRVSIPATVPAPGHWKIEAGMYNPATGKRIPLHIGDELRGQDVVLLGTIEAKIASSSDFSFDFDGEVTLVGARIDSESVGAGGILGLVLDWDRALPEGKYRVFVHVLGEDNQIWGRVERPLAAKNMRLALPMDSNAPAGVFPIEVGVYSVPSGERLAVYDVMGQDNNDRVFLGPIRITTP